MMTRFAFNPMEPIQTILACAVLSGLGVPSALVQGTAFIYQGRLDKGGRPLP